MKDFDINGLRLAEYQGKLFELSYDLNCSSKIFLRRFLNSKLLKNLDLKRWTLFSLDPREGIEQINEQFGVSDYGHVKYSKESLFWMGYLYRYIAYTRETDTRLLFALFKPDQLNQLYFVYHTQSPEWCIDNILKLNNRTEDIFDNNWRLKQAILGKLVI